MISIDELKKLASLARIEIEEGEAEGLAKDMGKILSYVDAVKKISSKKSKIALDQNLVKNVLREDVARKSGDFTDDILANAPQTSESYIVVKKIIHGK